MTRNVFKLQGITLHTLKFGDYDLIATVFTREAGVVKLIIKRGLSLKNKSPITPLTRAEFVYTAGKGEIHVCKETDVLERYYGHSPSLAKLEAGCALAQAVHHSQMLEKPAPQLYDLFCAFLAMVNHQEDPNRWVCSFLLKILKHEGLIDTYSSCGVCHAPIEHVYASRGEGFCKEHSPPQAIILKKEEVQLLNLLAHSRSLTELSSLETPINFVEKIKILFKQSLAH